MILELALVEKLKATAALTAIVGTKVFPLVAPPKDTAGNRITPPYVVYQRIAGNHEKHLAATDTLATATVQIDCYSTSYLVSINAAKAVRLALDGFRGTMGTVNTVEVRRAELIGSQDRYERPTDGSELGTHWASMDFEFRYIEATS